LHDLEFEQVEAAATSAIVDSLHDFDTNT
jgi:isopropylmalate/homocitrate/citramalate synthase